MRARLSAIGAGLLVMLGYPLVQFAARATDPAAGDLDLSDAWDWPPLVVAGLATAAAVFFRCAHRDAVRRGAAAHASFEYHDSMLQSVVAARMALDLDETEHAGRVLDGVIVSARDVVTSFVEPRAATLPERARHEVV